jgi:hypothetical protein
MKTNFLAAITIILILFACQNQKPGLNERVFNSVYEGENLNRLAFPIGGIGAGMFCLEGNGAIYDGSTFGKRD